jgi:hypothetical protein
VSSRTGDSPLSLAIAGSTQKTDVKMAKGKKIVKDIQQPLIRRYKFSC